MSRTSIRCLAFASALAAAAFATAASANPFEFFPFGQPFSYQQQQRDVPAPPFARDSDSRSSYGHNSYARVIPTKVPSRAIATAARSSTIRAARPRAR